VLAVLAFVCVASPARAEPSLFERAATFDPTIRFGDIARLTIQPMLEARWTGAEAALADPSSLTAFSVPRARLMFTTDVLDFATAVLRVGVRSDGSATFERAYVEARWRGLRIRGGQMHLPLNAGEEPEAQKLTTTDFCSYSNFFAGGETQGVELQASARRVRFVTTIGNGARTGFTELFSPIVANIALTGRAELALGKRDALKLDSTTSFREGQKMTARLAAVAHYQAAKDDDVELLGGDVDVRGSGFAFLASATYMRLAQTDHPLVEQIGGMVLASVFASRHVELWAQFDAIVPIGSRAPLPPAVANGQPGTTLFRTLAFGSNVYVLPNVHRLKLQLDVETMFDAQTTSAVPPNATLGVLPAAGPQVTMRAQVVFSL
jgi:hypothetical protein